MRNGIIDFSAAFVMIMILVALCSCTGVEMPTDASTIFRDCLRLTSDRSSDEIVSDIIVRCQESALVLNKSKRCGCD